MQKVFAKKLKDDTFSFYEDDIYHLTVVLKAQLNTELICFYEQTKYLCKIVSLTPLLAQIIKPIELKQKAFQIDLFQAIIKPKPFELIYKKAIELDVDNFYPIMFNRSQNNISLDYARLDGINKNSCMQSNRDQLMNTHHTMNVSEMIKVLINNQYDKIILAYEKNDDVYLNPVMFESNNKIAIIIGPEGGFTINEIESLSQLSNIKFIRLTNTILRSETAAIYTISVTNNILNMKGK